MNKEGFLSANCEENELSEKRESIRHLVATKTAEISGLVVALVLLFFGNYNLQTLVVGWTAMAIAFGMTAIEKWIVVAKTRDKIQLLIAMVSTAITIFAILRLTIF